MSLPTLRSLQEVGAVWGPPSSEKGDVSSRWVHVAHMGALGSVPSSLASACCKHLGSNTVDGRSVSPPLPVTLAFNSKQKAFKQQV